MLTVYNFLPMSTALLAIDFDSTNTVDPGLVEIMDHGQMLISQNRQYYDHSRMKLLTPESEKAAIDLIHQFGLILGPKRSAYFVDSCVASVFKDCVARVENGMSLFGRGQATWCHEWIGILALIRHMIVGAFGQAKIESKSHSNRKRSKYLKSLASWIMPIIVSYPLWDLPTSFRDAEDSKRDSSSLEIHRSVNEALSLESEDLVAPMALRGNACFMCGLLHIISTIFTLLRNEAAPFLPTVLYLLLEKASAWNVLQVKETATAVLKDVAGALEYTNLAEMIHEKMDVIAGEMLATLRIPGGGQILPQGENKNDLVGVATTIRAVLGFVSGDNMKHTSKHTCKSHLSYLIELVTAMVEHFDRFESKDENEFEATLAMIFVIESIFRYMIWNTGAAEKIDDNDSECGKDNAEPWLDLLDDFRISTSKNDDIDHADALSPKEGFEAYRNEQDSLENNPETTTTMKEAPFTSKHEIHFVNVLVSRCTFFLSNASLKLQIASSEAMTSGFQYLAIVARMHKVGLEGTLSHATCNISNGSNIFGFFTATL